MLIAVERLLIKLRQPASRAAELIQLRRRLRDERAADVDETERTLAREVHARKLAVVAELDAVASCRSCATGQPKPVGHYDGGACCSGVTGDLFDDNELAALVHAGTRASDLTPPQDAHAGCAFRGSRGCTLAVEHRPARCVHYICNTLRHELYDRGQLDSVEGKHAALALCARSGLVFCEDFEALPLGPATSSAWTTESAAGQLAIDATHARGQHALRVSTTGNGRARLQKMLALPSNSAWGTMHAWVSGFPTAPDYAHYTLVELAGTGNTSLVRPIGGQYAPAAGATNPAGAFWGVGSDGGATGDWTNWKRSAPSTGGQWLCLEFHLDAATDAIDIYIDGVAHPELSVTKTSHGGNQVDFVFPTFNKIWFGWWLYQLNPTPGTYDVWLDDLALGASRLGCD